MDVVELGWIEGEGWRLGCPGPQVEKEFDSNFSFLNNVFYFRFNFKTNLKNMFKSFYILIIHLSENVIVFFKNQKPIRKEYGANTH